MQDIYMFRGNYIVYQGKYIALDSSSLLLDGSLDDDTTKMYTYVYHDLKTVLDVVNRQEKDGKQITVYIAPYVYWIDDPDAEDTVYPEEGYGEPYGMVVDCDSLKLTGLTDTPSEVVLAGNRGQSHGAMGNYTMFYFRVRHLELANLTLGNYCSVDLEYHS